MADNNEAAKDMSEGRKRKQSLKLRENGDPLVKKARAEDTSKTFNSSSKISTKANLVSHTKSASSIASGAASASAPPSRSPSVETETEDDVSTVQKRPKARSKNFILDLSEEGSADDERDEGDIEEVVGDSIEAQQARLGQ